MKRLILIISCALFLFVLPLTAYAAENDGDGVTITVVIPQTKKPTPTPAPTLTPPKKYLYPVSVKESQDNGRREIIKTYELGAGEKPDDISRESFTREGWLYELTDVVKKESASADMREYIELVEQFSATNDTASILKLFDSSYEFTNENGYMGTMTLDISTLKVETAGTKSSSYTVSATREYPHLSSNDTSLIPKTITDNGRTLTLSNIDWKGQNYTTVDYDQIADSYTAIATYTGTAYKTSVTGYTATAEYRGTLSKIIKGKTVYTAYFLGVPIVTGTVNKPSETAPETTAGTMVTPTEETSAELPTEPTITEPETPTEPIPTETKSQSENIPSTETETAPPSTTETEPTEKAFNFLPVLLAVLIGAGIGGGFVFFYFQKFKKNKEVVPHEDEENTD